MRSRFVGLLFAGAAALATWGNSLQAGEVLVADRKTGRVLRYSDNGTYLGVLINSGGAIFQPNGLALSADGSKLFVADLFSQVVRYDYSYSSGTATNPFSIGLGTYVSSVDSTIYPVIPGGIAMSPDGSKFYVTNLGVGPDGDTIAQYKLDGTSAGPNLVSVVAGAGLSGVAFTSSGDLVTSNFNTDMVLRSSGSSLVPFVGPAPDFDLAAAFDLLVDGNSLYVSSYYTSTVAKYDISSTPALDPTFGTGGLVGSLVSPAHMMLAPDGIGLLVAELGVAPDGGDGWVSEYALSDGHYIGLWASNSTADPSLGFSEATAFLEVPEPATLAVLTMGVAMLGLRRRKA